MPDTVLDADKVVNAPVDAAVAPTVVPLIAPPVMATALAACVDIVPRPDMSVFGIVADAVRAAVPVPLTYPVRVIAPVPPLATGRVPVKVEMVGPARTTAAPAPAPSVTIIAFVPVAMVTEAPEPCAIAID